MLMVAIVHIVVVIVWKDCWFLPFFWKFHAPLGTMKACSEGRGIQVSSSSGGSLDLRFVFT